MNFVPLVVIRVELHQYPIFQFVEQTLVQPVGIPMARRLSPITNSVATNSARHVVILEAALLFLTS